MKWNGKSTDHRAKEDTMTLGTKWIKIRGKLISVRTQSRARRPYFPRPPKPPAKGGK